MTSADQGQAGPSESRLTVPGGVTLWRSSSSFEAVQITAESDLDAIAEWCGGKRETVRFEDGTQAEGIRLLTRSGHVTATEGNWISMDQDPPSVWEPSAFPLRFEPVRLAAPAPSEPVMELLERAWSLLSGAADHMTGARQDWRAETHAWGDRYRRVVAEYTAAKAGQSAEPVAESEQPPARLANVEVKGFRDLGVVAVSEITLAGVPFLHAENRDGSAADFPASSVHFIAWLPPGSPWPDKPKAIASRPATFSHPVDGDYPDDDVLHAGDCRDDNCAGECTEGPF